ncbi:MAG: hypothetical protein ACREUL_14545 [Steroidobacteraceae bacterium]
MNPVNACEARACAAAKQPPRAAIIQGILTAISGAPREDAKAP